MLGLEFFDKIKFKFHPKNRTQNPEKLTALSKDPPKWFGFSSFASNILLIQKAGSGICSFKKLAISDFGGKVPFFLHLKNLQKKSSDFNQKSLEKLMVFHQPISKICGPSNWIISPNPGWKIQKYLKPPPRKPLEKGPKLTILILNQVKEASKMGTKKKTIVSKRGWNGTAI